MRAPLFLLLIATSACSHNHETRNCVSNEDCTEEPGGRCVIDAPDPNDRHKPAYPSTDMSLRYCAYPSSSCPADVDNLRWSRHAPARRAGKCMDDYGLDDFGLEIGAFRPPEPCHPDARSRGYVRDWGWPEVKCPASTRCLQYVSTGERQAYSRML